MKEKEIATKRILKSGIGIHLLEAVQKTRERQEKEKMERAKEEERRRKEEEKEKRRAERERERAKREERKAKESIIVVEDIDPPAPGANTTGEGKLEMLSMRRPAHINEGIRSPLSDQERAKNYNKRTLIKGFVHANTKQGRIHGISRSPSSFLPAERRY